MKCRSFLATIAGFLLLIALFVTVLDVISFDRSFYKTEYIKYNNAEIIGISEEDLENVTEVLLSYIEGDRDNLDVEASISGEYREVFNQKEKDHMVDVKVLYQTAISVRNGCFLGFIIVALIYYKKYKQNSLYYLCKGYLKAFGYTLSLFIVVGFFAFLDFNAFWTLFHQLVFTNDLWLLNPNTDILIMMVPLGFFYDLVFKIATTYLVSVITLMIIAAFIKRRGTKS